MILFLIYVEQPVFIFYVSKVVFQEINIIYRYCYKIDMWVYVSGAFCDW